jgi:hypothetical protein
VYRSVDGGSTWQQLRTGMTTSSTLGIAVNDSGVVFVGTLNGQVYRSAQPTVSMVDHSEHPWEFALYQNYPNPFNPSTTIRFAIPDSRFTLLRIFNLLGQQVATLVNEMKQAGQYEVKWDAEGLASGVYLYRLEAGEFQETKRMVLMR